MKVVGMNTVKGFFGVGLGGGWLGWPGLGIQRRENSLASFTENGTLFYWSYYKGQIMPA